MSKNLPGTPPVLAGYSYVRPLGVGGFADVFLFEQDQPRRSVAVKVLLQSVVDDDVRRMFNTEADVMARLSAHPSILTVYDASVSADGRPYIVMEHCPGSYATRYRNEQIGVAEVLGVGVRIASALETAHRAGFLHRDIKPSNILTSSFGTPVLADFGIASSLSHSTSAMLNTEQLFAMSIPWSAPEVIEKRVTGSVASELWGLGATLYTLLAGRSPFEIDGAGRNTSEALAARIVKAKYVPIARSDVPPALEQLLAQAMSRDPLERPKSMFEFASELQNIQKSLGIVPSALETTGDRWSGAASEVDFNDTTSRGPVISTVPNTSTRLKARQAVLARETGDETRLRELYAEPKQASQLVRLVVISAVVTVVAVSALIAAVVIGGM